MRVVILGLIVDGSHAMIIVGEKLGLEKPRGPVPGGITVGTIVSAIIGLILIGGFYLIG